MRWTSLSTSLRSLSSTAGVFDNDDAESPNVSFSLASISVSLIHVTSVDQERKEVDDECGELGRVSGVEDMTMRKECKVGC
jgi:hypothetical protein